MTRYAVWAVFGAVLIAAVLNIASSGVYSTGVIKDRSEPALQKNEGVESEIHPDGSQGQAEGDINPISGRGFNPQQHLVRISKTKNAKLEFCSPCSKKCQKAILQRVRDSLFNANLIRDAMKGIAEAANGSTCAACHPASCACHLVQPLGFDAVCGPKVVRSKIFTTLPHVPSHRKMTSINVEEYQRRSEANENVTQGPLAVYNPSIISIPQTAKESIQALYLPKIPTYIASFRVSDVGACNIVRNFDWRTYGVNLLALVVLDQDLEMLDHVILDVNQDVKNAGFEDFRLFLIEGTIFVSFGMRLLPIQVTSASSLDGFTIPNYLNHNTNLRVAIPPGRRNSTVFLFGLPTTAGKNFQFFQDHQGNSWMEFWPWQPHVLGAVNMKIIDPTVAALNHESNRTMPEDSFVTNPLPPFTKERGSSCCVMLGRKDWPEQKMNGDLLLLLQPYDHVYLGISHARNKNQKSSDKIYLSRFYVFLPEWPFDIVARSGPFCLFGADSNTSEPLRNITLQHPLRVNRELYSECPMFHYISGMVASEDHILVMYGILDCFSRLVEFTKKSISEMLFSNLNTQQRVV